MTTIELVRTDTDPEEILHSEEIVDEQAGRRLYAYALRAELLTRDEEGDYTARVAQEPEI